MNSFYLVTLNKAISFFILMMSKTSQVSIYSFFKKSLLQAAFFYGAFLLSSVHTRFDGRVAEYDLSRTKMSEYAL